MRKKVGFSILFFIAAVLTILPNQASAFSMKKILTDIVVTPLREGAEYLLQQSLVGVGTVITSTTNFEQYEFMNVSIDWARYIAVTLLVLNFLKELITSMIQEGYGDGGKPIDMLMGQAIKSVALIYSSQWIFENVLVAANNAIVTAVMHIDSGVQIAQTFSESGAASKADEISGTILAGNDAIGVLILMLFLIIILGIGFIILVIAGGIRYAQMLFLLVIGPILAVSAVNKGEAFNTWIRESVAVVFTQSLHVWLLVLLLNLLGNGGFWDIMGAIGVLVMMIGGPSVIKPYLHSTGTGGALIGAGRAAAYRLMMRGAIPR